MSNKLQGLELEVDKPGRMQILHPKTNLPMIDAEGAPAWVDIYSTDSEIARKFGREMKTARLRIRNPNAMTGDKLEDEEVELFAALTAGWRLLDFEGQEIDLAYSRKEAIALYSNHKMNWLFDQVKDFASARANFSGASSTS